MNIRDNFVTTKDFWMKKKKKYLDNITARTKRIENKDRNGKKRTTHVLFLSVFWLINILYSCGDSVIVIKYYLQILIKYVKDDYLFDNRIQWYSDGKQYMVKGITNAFQDYRNIISILSLTILLEVKNEDVQTILETIYKDIPDGAKDNMIQFVLKANGVDIEITKDESFDRKKFDPYYIKLIKALNAETKEESQKLIKEYLEKDHYDRIEEPEKSYTTPKNYKPLYQTDAYYGYWCFEAAAIVKVLGLDDSSFIDNPFYPKDLVHWPPEEPEKTKSFWNRLFG